MTVTVAPATTPPLWSVTVPLIRPKLPCENAGRQSKSTANTPPSNCTAFLLRAPQHLLLSAVTEFISGPPVQDCPMSRFCFWPRTPPVVRFRIFKPGKNQKEQLAFPACGSINSDTARSHLRLRPSLWQTLVQDKSSPLQQMAYRAITQAIANCAA